MVHRAGLEPAIHRGNRSLAWRVFQFHHLCILALRERFERPWAVKHRLLSGEVPYQLGYRSIFFWRRMEVPTPTAFLLPSVF